MMELIIIDHEDHSEVQVRDNGNLTHAYVFDDHRQARAFCTGFNCARVVASSKVQELPISYNIETKAKA